MVTIAIFEHDTAVRNLYKKIISSYFKDKDIETFEFSEEKDVLNFLRNNSVQILITEYIPTGKGPEDKEYNCGSGFIKKIRDLSPKIQILTCTNHLPEDKNSKNNIVLRKPFHRGDLVEALRVLLKI